MGWAEHVITGRHTGVRMVVPGGKTTTLVEGARLERVDLSGQRFANYVARGSVFLGCDFSRSSWGGGVLSDVPPVEYRDCDFTAADLKATGPRFARFVGCRFADADLTDWNAMCAEFVDCVFSGTLLGVRFSGEPWGVARGTARKLRRRNAFTGNDFRAAVLLDCSVAGGIDVDANRWPEDHLIVRDAQRRIRATTDPSLKLYAIGAFALQRDLVLHPTDVGAPLAER